MTICYFTATGNCLYVAIRIGGKLLSIPQLMKQGSIEIEDDVVGIVAPVYAVEMPMMVREFLVGRGFLILRQNIDVMRRYSQRNADRHLNWVK